MFKYGTNSFGKNLQIFEPVSIGFPSRSNIDELEFVGTIIGDNAIIRSGTVLYCQVVIGDNFQTGHNVIIREGTRIGNNVSIGSSTIVEGDTAIGDHVNIQSMVYLPVRISIGNNVFIGPNAVFTNDRYPPSKNLCAFIIKDNAVVGANSTLLPGLTIGEGALIAAGAIVTKDVPDYKMAIGSPAKIKKLPKVMRQ